MMVSGHSAGITDMKFSPFYNNFLATSSDDKSIRTWKLPNSGEFFDILEEDMRDSQNLKRVDFVEKITSPVASMHGHEKRVTLIEFNRNANNILSSTSSDGEIAIWDLERSMKIFSYQENKNLCYDIKWNYFGNFLATTNKDRLVRIVDPRKQTTALHFLAHEGTRIGKCTWMGGFGTIQNKLITTGFTKAGSRSVKLWDVRNSESPIIDVQLDIMSSTLYPNFEDNFELLTVFGKGDGNFRVFKFDNGENSLTQIEEVRTTKPQRGVCFLPARCLDVSKSEVIRLFKAVNTDSIDVVSICLPRKQHVFSQDIFPDCFAGIPSCTSEDWRKGVSNPPVLVSMDPDSEKRPYLPNDDEDLLYRQFSKKSSSVLRGVPSANLSKHFSINSSRSFNYLGELPRIFEESEEQQLPPKKKSSSSLKKSSRSSGFFSKLGSMLSLGRKSSGSVKIVSKNSLDPPRSEKEELPFDNRAFSASYISDKDSVHNESNKSTDYDLPGSDLRSNDHYFSNPSCQGLSNKTECNLFAKKELEYSDVLDYRGEYSGTTSVAELSTCCFNIEKPGITVPTVNPQSSLRSNGVLGCSEGFKSLSNKGFVKRMVESINSANYTIPSVQIDNCCSFNRAKLCRKSLLLRSSSNASLETTFSKNSSASDFESISSNIINSIKKDLDEANKRIYQLDQVLKSNLLPARQKTIQDKQDIQQKSAELDQLKEEFSKLSSEYCDLNTAYRQQSALFGLYKEFYGELEDILAESFRGMQKVAADKF